MTNSIFAIMEYCMVRGLKFNSNLGRGIVSIYDPESDNFLEIKADIDAKVTIERIENWLGEVRTYFPASINNN